MRNFVPGKMSWRDQKARRTINLMHFEMSFSLPFFFFFKLRSSEPSRLHPDKVSQPFTGLTFTGFPLIPFNSFDCPSTETPQTVKLSIERQDLKGNARVFPNKSFEI